MRLTRPPAVQQAYVLHQHDWSESSLILDPVSYTHLTLPTNREV